MKRLLPVLFALAAVAAAEAQNLLPVRDSIGKLSVSVDPRTELLGAVQLISDYPLCTKNTPYSDRAKSYFGAFAGSDAVKCTKNLYEDGFAYDAPAALMLHYSCPPEMKLVYPYSDYLKGRANGQEPLERYREALSAFARESRFGDFWSDNKDFYRRVLDNFMSEMGEVDVVGMLEKYYKEQKGGFHVVLAPLFGVNNYGSAMPDADGGSDVYSFLSLYREKEGIPALFKTEILGLMFHEFSHSFVNPLTAKYADQVNRYSTRFEPLKEQMARQAYGQWQTCVNEHLIRAVIFRLLEQVNCSEAAQSGLQNDLRNHFGYLPALIEKLKEYESLRDSTGITFEDYLPTLLEVFGEAEFYTPKFAGPVNAIFNDAGAVCVYPTAGQHAGDVMKYAKGITDFVNSRMPNKWTFVADTTALNMSLKDRHIVCYGSVENNLLLKKYESSLPFRVENGVLYADRKYDDKAVRWIACMPNPQNPELGMVVYTALDDSRIAEINNVFHGPEDYCIFLDRDHILSRGNFEKKDGVWKFPQP